MKIEITKCYCIQLLDEDGNELDCTYQFCDREEAKQYGREMKAGYRATNEEYKVFNR